MAIIMAGQGKPLYEPLHRLILVVCRLLLYAKLMAAWLHHLAFGINFLPHSVNLILIILFFTLLNRIV